MVSVEAESDSDHIWNDDCLDRAEVADFLYRFLLGRLDERKRAGVRGSYVVNIDAAWGFGKSYFVQRFFEQLKPKHTAVFINAWETDFTDDPYTAVISEIDAFFRIEKTGAQAATDKLQNARKLLIQEGGKILLSAASGAVKQLARKALGEAFEEIDDVVEEFRFDDDDREASDPEGANTANSDENTQNSEALEGAEAGAAKALDNAIDKYANLKIAEFKKSKKSLARFRDSLDKLLKAYYELEQEGPPFFVFIDELDRCKPTYAITMLERIKHLFDVDNVVFLISTDTEQLAHSIKGVYGGSFDSTRYLQRFFSRTFTLPEASPDQIIELIVGKSGVDKGKWAALPGERSNQSLLSEISQKMKLSIREIEQSLDILLSITTLWDKETKIQTVLLYVLIIGFIKKKDLSGLWMQGINGAPKDQKWFQETLNVLSTVVVFLDDRSPSDTMTADKMVLRLAQETRKTVFQCIADLDKKSQVTAPSLIDRWTRSVFLTEFDQDDHSKTSYLRSYWDLIQHAGYLKAPADISGIAARYDA